MKGLWIALAERSGDDALEAVQALEEYLVIHRRKRRRAALAAAVQNTDGPMLVIFSNCTRWRRALQICAFPSLLFAVK